MARASKASLQIDRVYDAMQRGEKRLPAMVDKLCDLFDSGELRPKEMVMIASFIARMSQTRERAAEDLGLTKRSVSIHNPLFQVLAIEPSKLKSMKPEDRQALILDALRGKRIDALPAPEEAA